MRSLESMINKLSPLGVYNLNKGSIVYAELAAFAVGLDSLRDTLDTLLKEAFIETAEDFGIDNTERLVGNVREDLPLEKRREMLTERLSFGAGDFTLKGFERLMKLMGVEGRVEEYPKEQRLVLNLTEDVYSLPEREWILSQAKVLLPAHLNWDVVFWGFDWSESDAHNNTFLSIDSKGYTWEKIDYLV